MAEVARRYLGPVEKGPEKGDRKSDHGELDKSLAVDTERLDCTALPPYYSPFCFTGMHETDIVRNRL